MCIRDSPKVNVPAYSAKVGMVFQNFNLFNNMTVLENCIVGQVKVAKKKPEEARESAIPVSYTNLYLVGSIKKILRDKEDGK